jgi:hypothetical protein
MDRTDKVVYSAKVHTAGGREGAAQSDDGLVVRGATLSGRHSRSVLRSSAGELSIHAGRIVLIALAPCGQPLQDRDGLAK